jgi:hypothetical protein
MPTPSTTAPHSQFAGPPPGAVIGTAVPVAWKPGLSGNWTDGADWVGGSVPGLTDTVVLQGGGFGYSVTAAATVSIAALTINSSFASLRVGGAFSVQGAVQLAAGSLQVTAGGELDAAGGIVIGNQAILSSGLGAGGETLVANIVDNGEIRADGLHLMINGDISGSGFIAVNESDAAATLELNGAASQEVDLYGGATLKLDKAAAFTGTIYGPIQGDAVLDLSGSATFGGQIYLDSYVGFGNLLDLKGVSLQSYSYVDGVLTIREAGGASLALPTYLYQGAPIDPVNYAPQKGYTLWVSADGAGGTDIGFVTPKTIQWGANASGSWSTAASWVGGVAPFPYDAVTFSGTQTVSGDGAASSLTTNGNTTLTGQVSVNSLVSSGADASGLNGGQLFVKGGALVVAGDATIGAEASLYAQDGGSIRVASLTLMAPTVLTAGGSYSNSLAGVANDGVSSFEVGTRNDAVAGQFIVDDNGVVTGTGIGAEIFGATDIVVNGSTTGVSINSGRISNNGVITGGQYTIGGGVIENNGVINDNSNLDIVGQVSGAGQINVAAGAGLRTNGSIGALQTINLAGPGASIELDAVPDVNPNIGTANPVVVYATIAASILGFNASDTIEYGGAVTSATWANNILTLMNGADTVGTLNLVGDFASVRFVATQNVGNAGTQINEAPVGDSLSPPAGTASGDSYVWGPVSGSWDVAANWTDTTLGQAPAPISPGIHDAVTFNALALPNQTQIYQIVSGVGAASSVVVDGAVLIAGHISTADLKLTTAYRASVVNVARGGALSDSGDATTALNDALLVDGGQLSIVGHLTLGEGGRLTAQNGGFVTLGSLAFGAPTSLTASAAVTVDAASSIVVGTTNAPTGGQFLVDQGFAVYGQGANYSDFEINAIDIVNLGSIDHVSISASHSLINSGEITTRSLTSTSIVNTGTIVGDGVLGLNGDVSGIGVIRIDAGGSLFVDGDVGAGQNIVFQSAGERLYLYSNANGQLSTVEGAIHGFDETDSIVLDGSVVNAADVPLDVTQATWSNNVLTFFSGVVQVGTLNLVGDYGNAIFKPVFDGSNTTITFAVGALPVAGAAPRATSLDGAAVEVNDAAIIAPITDPNASPLSVTAVSIDANSAGAGEAHLDPADQTVVFNPSAGFAGTAVLDVTVSDGFGLTTVQTVDIDVQVVASANPAPTPAPAPTFAHVLQYTNAGGATVHQDFDANWVMQDAWIRSVSGGMTTFQNFDGNWRQLNSTITVASGGRTSYQVFNDGNWVLTSSSITTKVNANETVVQNCDNGTWTQTSATITTHWSDGGTAVQSFDGNWNQTSVTLTRDIANGGVITQTFDGGWNQVTMTYLTHPGAGVTDVQYFDAGGAQTGAAITTVAGDQTTVQYFDGAWVQTSATILTTPGDGASRLDSFDAGWAQTSEVYTAANGSKSYFTMGSAGGGQALAGADAHSTTFVFDPGQLAGDTISNLHTFNLGGAVHDVIDFVGFGAGAALQQLTADTWQVSSDSHAAEVFTLTGGAVLAVGDYAFTATAPSGEAQSVRLQMDPVASDGVITAADITNGFSITGRGIAGPAGGLVGQTVSLTVATHSYSAVVAADGAWSVQVGAGDLSGLSNGQAYGVTAAVTDATGEATTASATLLIEDAAYPVGASVQAAASTGQTLLASGGVDTLWGSGGGDTTWRGTAATLNADTLVNFGRGGDSIDLTDIALTGSNLAFVEDASQTFGVLTASDGTRSASVVLFGQFAASGFQATSDGGAGLAVTYAPTITTPPVAIPH